MAELSGAAAAVHAARASVAGCEEQRCPADLPCFLPALHAARAAALARCTAQLLRLLYD